MKNSIEYVDPDLITTDKYIKVDTPELFKISTHFTRIPVDDQTNTDLVYYFVKRTTLFARLEGGEGYVYVLECKEQPGIVKIGMTERTPQERLQEINRGTGVIFPWTLVEAFPCRSPRSVEQLVHLELGKYRVNSQKEGFSVFPNQAKEAILRIIKEYGAELNHTPEHWKQTAKKWFMKD